MGLSTLQELGAASQADPCAGTWVEKHRGSPSKQSRGGFLQEAAHQLSQVGEETALRAELLGSRAGRLGGCSRAGQRPSVPRAGARGGPDCCSKGTTSPGSKGQGQEGHLWERVSPHPLLWAPVAAHLGGLVGHRSRAAHTELLQLRPGEEQDVLLGEQVRGPQDGNGTQGSLQSEREVSRVHPRREAHLTGSLPSCGL